MSSVSIRASALLFALVSCAPGPVDSAAFNASRTQPIVGGETCGEGDFISAGVIVTRGEIDGSQRAGMVCTGTLIAPDVVLTAGHCTELESSFWSDRGENIENFFSLALDVQDFGRTTTTPPQPAFAIDRLVAHPDYDRANFNLYPVGLAALADLGLAFLLEPVTQVAPAVLPADDASDLLQLGTPVNIVGYGRPGVSIPDGIKLMAQSHINEVNPDEMQIGDTTPTPVTCLGDSGGPTYLEVDDGLLPRRRLIGITSRAYDASVCEVGGVAMRTDAHRDWIEQTLMAACESGQRDPTYCSLGGRLSVPFDVMGGGGQPLPPEDEVGCECRSSAPSGLPALLLLALSLWRGRRRPSSLRS